MPYRLLAVNGQGVRSRGHEAIPPLECDGATAVVRSMSLTEGCRLLLSNGETIGPIDEAGFQRRFSDRAERVGDV